MDHSNSNVRHVPRQHAESVLFVVQQLGEVQLSALAHDYGVALGEIERLGIADAALQRGAVWDPANEDSTSYCFVLTLPGVRAMRTHKSEETEI